ncbi:BtaA family protein [Aureispira sp. CCB-E]|uniref:DUF3419 family protein n=1 Tax=Aureispira sp. CCB-E TaxID=3051121 RepID=UPI002868F6F2|nr:BtaA family protein [Aureispira sp. CCB-E]WMX12874.1 BtaA family protein [Aureispira sp. CCB-E]
MLQLATNKAKDWMFGKIHGNNLIYNTCWEDPECDRRLLELNQESEVVMITSAGCNALDYSLDDPTAIHCVDVNYRQNALLELKKAFYQAGTYKTLFRFFGEGSHETPEYCYQNYLRDYLPTYAQRFWDKKIEPYFGAYRFRPSFYFYGTAGTFAWLFGCYMRLRRSLYDNVQQLLHAPTLEIQAYWYNIVEQKIIGNFIQWAMKQPVTLSLLGIPRTQSKLVETEYMGGVIQFIQDSLRYIFTQLPIRDNYFWQLYINGRYTEDCCPNYLKKANFERLQETHTKIQTHTTTISNFLKQNPKAYSHYVLLDHQDWLAANDTKALKEEWRLILKNSRPGTKILLRSGASEINFFPDFVQEKVNFEHTQTATEHLKDRVGTYGSVYCGIVR